MNKVSVIIPLYNLAHLVTDAIDSVLSQTYRDIEIIVVDDGSTDNAKEVLSTYIENNKIHYIYKKNQGLSAARNTGIKVAQGKYIKFLDSDDYLYPEQIEKQVNDIKDDNNILSVTDYHDLRPNGQLIRKRVYVGRKDKQMGIFIETNRAVPHAFLTPKDLIKQAGGFDETLTSCEDWDLWLKILRNGATIKYLPYVGCCYRILMTSMSADMNRMFLQECKVMEKVSNWFVGRKDVAPFLKDCILTANTRLMEEGMARNIDPISILPNSLKLTDELFRDRKKGLFKILFMVLGVSRCVRIRYEIKKIHDLNYEYKILNMTNLDRYGDLFPLSNKNIRLTSKVLNAVIHWNYQKVISGFKRTLPISKLFFNYLKDSFWQKINTLSKTNKNIFVTLDEESLFRSDDGVGREAFYVLKAFSDGGYNVYFNRPSNFKHYCHLGFLGRLIYSIKNLKFTSKLPENTRDFIYAFDTIRSEFLKLPWKRLLYINIKKSALSHLGNVIPMQFPMFPYVYTHGLDDNLESFRTLIRNCRIIFGGNLDTAYYDSPVFKNKYPHLMTRLEGVAALRNSQLEVKMITGKNDVRRLLNNREYVNSLVIIEFNYSYLIMPKIWLRILGQSDFFMCFSGTDYPMCHNAIEAMAVGCIPILAYEDWFDPKLEHGKNAIVYKDKEDLINKIRMVMQMPTEEISKLRQEVLKYYDQYLSKGRLIQRYEAESQQVSTLMLFPKIVSDHKGDVAAQNLIQAFKKLHIEERDFQ